MNSACTSCLTRRSSASIVAFGLLAMLLWRVSPAAASEDNLTEGETQLFVGHTEWINQVAFSRDRRRVFSLSALDGTFRVWDVTSGKEVRRFEKMGGLRSFSITPDGRLAVLGGSSDGLRFWDLETGKEVRLLDNPSFFDCLGFSSDGRQMLVRGNRNLILVDVETATKVREFSEPEGVYGAAISADGKRLLTGMYRMARLWDVESGSSLPAFEGNNVFVHCPGFSPDGSVAFTGDTDGRVIQWDARTGKELRRFAPSGQYFLGASDSNTHPVAFTADFRVLLGATVFDPYELQLWDLAAGKQLHRFRGHTRRAAAVAISSDGRQVLSGGDDNTVRLWTIPKAINLGDLSGPKPPMVEQKQPSPAEKRRTESPPLTTKITDSPPTSEAQERRIENVDGMAAPTDGGSPMQAPAAAAEGVEPKSERADATGHLPTNGQEDSVGLPWGLLTLILIVIAILGVSLPTMYRRGIFNGTRIAAMPELLSSSRSTDAEVCAKVGAARVANAVPKALTSRWLWIGLAITGVPIGYIAGWLLAEGVFAVFTGHLPVGVRQEETVGLTGGLLGLILGVSLPLLRLRRIRKNIRAKAELQPVATDRHSLIAQTGTMPTQCESQPRKEGVGRSAMNAFFGILCLILGSITSAMAASKFLGPLWMLMGPALIAYGLYHMVNGIRRRPVGPSQSTDTHEHVTNAPDTTRVQNAEAEAGEQTVMDKQIANMSALGLLLCSIVPLAWPVAWIGLVVCRHPKARKRAWIMTGAQAALVVVAIIMKLQR